jgi:hypothetical protein
MLRAPQAARGMNSRWMISKKEKHPQKAVRSMMYSALKSSSL